MKFFQFILRAFSFKLFLAVIISMVSGFSMASLIAMVSQQLTRQTPFTMQIIVLFGVITLLAIGADLVSKWLMMSALGWTGYQLRISLARQILAKPYAQLESMGNTRLQTVFLDNTNQILLGLHQIPNLTVALTTLLGSLLYLGWLAPTLLGILVLLALPLLGGYWLLQRKANIALKMMHRTRTQADDYYRALTEGAKELKLNSSRWYAYQTQWLEPATSLSQQQATLARSWNYIATTWSQSIYFIFILVILGLAAWQPANNAFIAAYALIILYMKSAVTALLNSSGQWHEADMACRHLQAFGFTLSTQIDPPAKPAVPAATTPPVQLHLRNVVYHYKDRRDGQSFTLGPVSITMRSGEVIFLTGGNGSGKTTLIKVLTGLYAPHAGGIDWDGRPVTEQALEPYQQLFSVIFADFYLFDELLGLDTLDQHARYYLNKFQLQDKVGVHKGVFSTIDLSHGQRKRLALLTVYLENRPIYIFDEWASGQDPEFREIFYRQLLPDLKARGKLVIVSSHDHHYFSVADRIINLDYGKVTLDRRQNGAPDQNG